MVGRQVTDFHRPLRIANWRIARPTARERRWLAIVLAFALVLQWIGLPARALDMSALQLDIDTSICSPATGAAGHHAPVDRSLPWSAQLCLVAHGLDQTALPPLAAALAPAVEWRHGPETWLYPVALSQPRAPPQQPRAPPDFT